MIVLAIDPGYNESAWVMYDGEREQYPVLEHGIDPNDYVLRRLQSGSWHAGVTFPVVLEQIESFGMAVGREVFETVFWTGRMFQAARYRGTPDRMPRKAVKLHLCQSARANDSNIRAALIDRFGGSKDVAVGRKASPGPLFGIRSHEWAALAIAVTWWDINVNSSQERQVASV